MKPRTALRAIAFFPLLFQSCSDPLPNRRAALRQYDEPDSFEAIFISDTAPSTEVWEHDVWMAADYSVVRRFENGKWEEMINFYQSNKAILHCLDLGEEPARFARAFIRSATANNASFHEAIHHYPGKQDGMVPDYDMQTERSLIFSLRRNADRYERRSSTVSDNPYATAVYETIAYAWRGEDGEPHFYGGTFGVDKETSFAKGGNIDSRSIRHVSYAIAELIVDMKKEGGIYYTEKTIEDTEPYVWLGPKDGACVRLLRYSMTPDGRYLKYLDYRIGQSFIYEDYGVRATKGLQCRMYFYDIRSTPKIEIPESYLEYEAGTMPPPISDGGDQ